MGKPSQPLETWTFEVTAVGESEILELFRHSAFATAVEYTYRRSLWKTTFKVQGEQSVLAALRPQVDAVLLAVLPWTFL